MQLIGILVGLVILFWLVASIGWTGLFVLVVALRLLGAILRLLFGR